MLLPFDTRVGGGRRGIQNSFQSVRIFHLLQQYATLLSHIGVSHQLYFRMELRGRSFGYEAADKCSLRTGLDPDSRILLNWALVWNSRISLKSNIHVKLINRAVPEKNKILQSNIPNLCWPFMISINYCFVVND